MTESNRRGFLRALGLRAAQGAKEAADVAGPLVRATSPLGSLDALLASPPDDDAPAQAAPAERQDAAPERPDAAPPTCALTVDELRAFAIDGGLSDQVDAIAALARPTARLVPMDAPDGADAWVDFAAAARVADDATAGETVLLVQVDQSSPALAGTALAADGWLVVFADTPSDDSTRIVRLGQPAALSPTMRPMALRAHLALPRVWNAAVQALELDAEQADAYVRLRDRVATLQGIDVEHGGGETRAYHRLLGYPDETTGRMPEDCAAIAGDGDWNLLAQISLPGTRRIYTWLRSDDAADTAVTFVR